MNRRSKTRQSGQQGAIFPRNWPGRDWLFALLLFAALLLAYHPAWNGTPIWDDDAHLTKPQLCSLAGLFKIWFVLGATQQYYPVAHSAFWLQHWLWSDGFAGYHLVNIFLHAFAALLLVQILRRLEIRGAWLAAALWALHPVQVESVAWMSELKNTLSGVFYMGAALAYLRFDRTRSFKPYFTAFALFALGLLTKSVIATLPGAMLLILYWYHGKLLWRKDVRPLAPFFLTGIVSGLFTAWVERALIGAHGDDFNYSLLERGMIAGRAFWFYLGKLAWPADLIFIYPRWKIDPSVWWQLLFPAMAVVLVVVLVCMRKRWGKAPLVAVLYFAGTLFPALGFLNIYPFRFSFVADHFQYLASIGPLVLAAAGASRMFDSWLRNPRFLQPVFCTGLLGMLGLLTWKQAGIYADKETLYRATIARNPECWMAYNNLGRAMADQGRLEDAAADYREAMRIYPACDEAHINLATLMVRQGRMEDAIAQFREAYQINSKCADAHYDIGNILLDQGRMDEAIAEFREALRIDPLHAPAHFNLGIALLRQGRTDEATTHYREALRINPDYMEARINLGIVLMQQGKPGEGIAQFREAVRINPASADAHADLGKALLQQGQKEEAIAEFQEARRIQSGLGVGP